MSRTPGIYELVQPLAITQFPALEGVWLGDDTVQSNGSFKIRGALHAIQQAQRYQPESLQNGVFCASAGNAGQGAALAATYLGADSHIFMPANAAVGKIEAVEHFGGNVTLVKGVVDDALREAQTACQAKNGFFLHPFDDAAVIEGQASLGHEIAASGYNFDTVFVPVGGGGLLAGVCKALAERGASTTVLGVQLEGCDAFAQSVRARQQVELENINPLADGVAVKRAGTLTLRIATSSPNFGGMITVSPRQLGCALTELDIFTDITAETAAGLSLAGLKKHRAQHSTSDARHLVIITGKHRDPLRFQQLISA